MGDRDRLPPTDPETQDEGDSLLREIAAAPSVDVPLELATMILLEPGTVVDGKFRIEERLGAGGMGVVYSAQDVVLGREVAVKLMRLERGVGRLGERLPEVFDREARATARLNHPNIVTLHQFGNWNGILYLVLERLRGETLGAHLERGRVPLLDALAIMELVANALVHTHAAGVIHRDLKPQNVFLLADGGVKVLDFGVSGLGLVPASGPAASGQEPAAPRTTISHAGTPGYMAPEQWAGEPQDARTDLWALGVMLYQLVTDALPFGMRAAGERAELAPLAARLPPEANELVALVEKCLVIDREDRAGDAAEVARTLRRIRTRLDPALAPAVQPRSLASRLGRGSLALASVLSVAIAAALWWPRSQSSACDRTERQLAGIWDTATRARLGAMFDKASPHGASTWTAVAMTLDRYSREWVAMSSQACRAGSASPPLVTRCLDERRGQLARFVRDHESVGASEILAALAAAQALPPVADCTDPSYLARWAGSTTETTRSDSGLVRAAMTINGPGLDLIHSALAIGDDFVVTGVATDGGTFAGKRIDATGYLLARVTSDGALTWFETNAVARVIELAPGHAGDVLVAGFYTAATRFAGTALPAPPGGSDCFAAALDGATGVARWVTPCGATQDGEVRAVASDRDGNLYVAGEFGGRARFGGTREIDAQARPTMVPFVASWSPSGVLRWVVPGRGTGSVRSKGIAVDGDVVIVGTRVTGAGWLGDRELRSGGCIVARLDRATGAIRWLRELAIVKCELDDVAVKGDRVAAVGRYRGRGAWIEELAAADGANRWSARFGTHDQEGIRSAMYAENGALTVVGWFGGPSLAIGPHTLHGNGASDVFLAGFDQTGGVLGALAFGGPADDRVRWIGPGPAGTAIVTGRYANSIIVGSRELRAVGGFDGMVLELALPWLAP